jgi:hypothetical protein
MARMQEKEDQNERELKYANQRDENARTPLSENQEKPAKPAKDYGEVPPDQQHTRIP